MIAVDRDQAGWRSTRIYGDGELSGLWVPDKVVVHWGGATVPPVTKAGERSLLRGWQRFHINSRGWRDIAYNYAVGNSGTTYRLRGWNPSGATSGDFEGDGIPENNEAVACVWLGGSGGRISGKAFDAMGGLVRDVLTVIDLEPHVVIGHRDVKGTTSCPGDTWSRWIQEAGWVLPSGADMEDDMVWLTALQRQTPAWFEAVKAQTGKPGGRAGYWGESHNTEGVRIAEAPTDKEWDNAVGELAGAALEAGAIHPELIPGPKGDKGDTGAPGSRGPVGPQGVQGVQGIQGPEPVSGTISGFVYE